MIHDTCGRKLCTCSCLSICKNVSNISCKAFEISHCIRPDFLLVELWDFFRIRVEGGRKEKL